MGLGRVGAVAPENPRALCAGYGLGLHPGGHEEGALWLECHLSFWSFSRSFNFPSFASVWGAARFPRLLPSLPPARLRLLWLLVALALPTGQG